MASDKQVSANRRNAAKSTGPTTHDGKQRSRRNAIYHGLTAATVVPAIEDAEEFERFADAIMADYQPISTIEHELVARLASLLWRLRRSTLIETNLFQLQAKLAMKQKLRGQGNSDFVSPGMAVIYRLLHNPGTDLVPSQDTAAARELAGQTAEAADISEPSARLTNPATVFLRLCNLTTFPIERINRYETALWRQLAQTLFILDACKRRQSL